jgi:acyl-CoA synthetase (AMP-forming)/AMP-acid ligase II
MLSINKQRGEQIALNIQNLLIKTSRIFAGRTALVEGSYRVTFHELNSRVNKLANGLLKQGFNKGDRAAIYLKNCHQYLEFRLALEKIGVVHVPINYYLSIREIEYILSDSGASAIICDDHSYSEAINLAEHLPHEIRFILATKCNTASPSNVSSTYEEMIAQEDDDEPNTSVDAEDLCSINYTSGTTGRPKGVMLTQKNWMEVYKNMLINRDIQMDDRLLHIGPLTHASGSYFMPFFLRGAESIIIPGGFDLNLFFEYLEKFRITVFTCVPTVLMGIMNDPRIKSVDKSSLRMIGYGAAPMPTEQIKKALELFGPLLVQNYGQTEAYMTVTYLSQQDHQDSLLNNERRLASIGKPYTFVQVEVMDDQGQLLGPNQVGELVIKSDHVMKGYWKLPEETKAVLRDGWLLTGDLAKKDEGGYLYLLGRKKEMIISGGFNIYPQEIEEVLYSIPSVAEAAVIGLGDPYWGEKVVAFIVFQGTAPQQSLEEVQAVCKKHLGFKKPKEYIILDSLPKNSIGKIDKKKIKEIYYGKGESQIG